MLTSQWRYKGAGVGQGVSQSPALPAPPVHQPGPLQSSNMLRFVVLFGVLAAVLGEASPGYLRYGGYGGYGLGYGGLGYGLGYRGLRYKRSADPEPGYLRYGGYGLGYGLGYGGLGYGLGYRGLRYKRSADPEPGYRRFGGYGYGGYGGYRGGYRYGRGYYG